MISREERKRLDILVDEKVAQGHSNHCAMRQVLGHTTCVCNKDKEEKNERKE